MAHITLRTLIRNGPDSWALTTQGPLDVRPGRAVLAAALASPHPDSARRGDVSWPLREAGDVIDALGANEPGPLSWSNGLRDASPHFRRYLTQSAAIALTVELAEMYGWDPFEANHALFWLDDVRSLTSELASLGNSGGPVPDIIFETPEGWMTLESRGRSEVASGSAKLPTSKQQERLGQLEVWAQSVSRSLGYEPRWGMAWASFATDETVVDFFDPGEPIQLSTDSVLQLREFGKRLTLRFERSLRNSDGVTRLPVQDRTLDSAIRVIEDERGRQDVVGVAVLDGARVARERRSQEFDVVPFGRLLFFAGKVPDDRRYETDAWLGEAIESQLER